LLRYLRWPFLLALLIGLLLPLCYADEYRWVAVPGLVLGCWILLASVRAGVGRLRTGAYASGGFWGMLIAHAGVAVFVIGVTVVSIYEREDDVRLVVGESQKLGAYDLELMSLGRLQGENYTAIAGQVQVRQHGATVAMMQPEKRFYQTQPNNPMTEAGINATLAGDWYVSLGEGLGDGSWSARIQYKPLVRFIWGGALLMALGGAIAAADRRYRRRRQVG
jgi:cytochrome c-type biogenesis protein CcmF